MYTFCSSALEIGQIVSASILDSNAERGTAMVITGIQSANWRGSDRDVYAHIEYWYDARPATDDENAILQDYGQNASALRAVLKSLGKPSVATVDEAGIHTKPMRMLDSYDDRFDGSSKTIPLTADQMEVYRAFQNSKSRYDTACSALAKSTPGTIR
jgi:hypothetical protein